MVGWSYILELECKVHPQFLDFVQGNYLRQSNLNDDSILLCQKEYKVLLDIWKSLKIGNYFTEYTLTDNIFRCRIEKGVIEHKDDLWETFKVFLKYIIVHISSEITSALISSNDYGNRQRYYTDMELRGQCLILSDITQNIEHTWLNDEIIETRVIYNRPISRLHALDLTRLYI